MIPGYRAFSCLNMVQFEGIWIIHLSDLLFGNFPGKVKVSLFVSAAPVIRGSSLRSKRCGKNDAEPLLRKWSGPAGYGTLRLLMA